MQSGHNQRTSVGADQPWALSVKSPRQARCPACGLSMPTGCGVIAGQVLVCDRCVECEPRTVTMVICIAHIQSVPQYWVKSHGVFVFAPKRHQGHTVIDLAKRDGRWPASDMPCQYPGYREDWCRYFSEVMQQAAPDVADDAYYYTPPNSLPGEEMPKGLCDVHTEQPR